MATVKPKTNVVKSLKKAGFYGASEPKRLAIINKVTTKPQRIKMVDKLLEKDKNNLVNQIDKIETGTIIFE